MPNYEINFVPPQSGVYYIFRQHPTPCVAYGQMPHRFSKPERPRRSVGNDAKKARGRLRLARPRENF